MISALTQRSWEAEVDGEVIGAFAALAGTAPDAALTRLRRLRPGPLADACSRAVDARTVSLGDLWTATGVRPLRTAVAALDPALRDRFDQLLCALTIMITCRAPGTDLVTVVPPGAITVPGYPSTALDDQGGPWPRALAGAAELGADTSAFEDQITGHGLRVPASWLSGGGWTALWARAHR